MTYELALMEREELGEKRGREKERHSIVSNLLKIGMSFETISEATKLSVDKIKQFAKNIHGND